MEWSVTSCRKKMYVGDPSVHRGSQRGSVDGGGFAAHDAAGGFDFGTYGSCSFACSLGVLLHSSSCAARVGDFDYTYYRYVLTPEKQGSVRARESRCCSLLFHCLQAKYYEQIGDGGNSVGFAADNSGPQLGVAGTGTEHPPYVIPDRLKRPQDTNCRS